MGVLEGAGRAEYPGGRRVRRGDLVYIPGEPGLHRYRVLSYDPARGTALVRDAGGRVHRLPFAALAPI